MTTQIQSSSITVAGSALPAMPWEERPTGSNAAVWRYSGNPIIPANLLPNSNSIFNSAVVPFNGAWAGVFRCDDKRHQMNIHAGFSDDALSWRINAETITFACDDPEIGRLAYRYDPRVVETHVRNGENAGRTLSHVNVVHELTRLGDWAGEPLALDVPAGPAGLRSAILIQNKRGGAILAAASE